MNDDKKLRDKLAADFSDEETICHGFKYGWDAARANHKPGVFIETLDASKCTPEQISILFEGLNATKLKQVEQERDQLRAEVGRLKAEVANEADINQMNFRRFAEAELKFLKHIKMLAQSLEWISDETKRDHREPDLYTKYGCVIHKASETLAKHEQFMEKFKND